MRNGIAASLWILLACTAPDAHQAPAPPAAAVAAPAPAAALERPGPGRLPRLVTPTAYEISLKVDPAQPAFSGEATLRLDVLRPTDRIHFHGVKLSIEEIVLTSGGRTLAGAAAAASGEGADPEAGELVATFPQPVAAGPATLRFRYTAPFDQRLTGLYRARSGSDWYASTQLEPADARKVFPCLDEPGWKVPFTITVTVPSGLRAVSNAPEASRAEKDGWTTVAFAPTRPLPTYLVALAVGPFDVAEGSQAPTPIRGLAPRGRGPLLVEALRYHRELLDGLEAYFGRPYPFEKLDALATPELAAYAMENPGLIIYREEALLIDPAATGQRGRQGVAHTVAHELAHQWFGNLVTMAWWDDLWLNEAFAEWVSTKVVDRRYPAFGQDLSTLGMRDGIFRQDALATARPIRRKDWRFQDGFTSFGLATVKGASVLGMLEQYAGEAAFQEGVRAYLNDRAWGSATSDDLFRALEAASKKEIRAVATSFLDRAGVPEVRAELSCAGGRATVQLTQRRYRALGGEALPEPEPWQVPVCVLYPAGAGAARECVLLREREQRLQLAAPSCPAWLHPNVGERGHYRWSVPAASLSGLARGLFALSSAAPEPERREIRRAAVALLDQTWAAVGSGAVDVSGYLALLEAASASEDPVVLDEVAAGVGHLAGVWDSLESAPAFHRWVRKLLEAHGRRLGWTPRPGEAPQVAEARGAVLGALVKWGRAEWAAAGALERARAYLKDPRSVEADVSGLALALAARAGRLELAELSGALERASAPADRLRVIAALASLPPGKDREQALGLVLTDRVRQQDLYGLLFPGLYRPDTRAQTFEFVKAHHDQIVARSSGFGGASGAQLASSIGSFCTAAERDAAVAYFQGKGLKGADRFIRQGTEAANQCIAIRAAGEQAVAAFLAGVK